MLFRIKAGNREFYLVRASLQSVMKVARAKVWEVPVGGKVSVLQGDKLIVETTRMSIFDEGDQERFGLLDDR
jgi:hypothetical protein